MCLHVYTSIHIYVYTYVYVHTYIYICVYVEYYPALLVPHKINYAFSAAADSGLAYPDHAVP